VEQRLPFLDHKLFETIKDIPASLLWRDGREKWVLREALKPFVSDAVYAGKKQPFSAPRSALREDSALLALAQELLRSEAAGSVPFLDRAGLIALADRLMTLPDQERSALESTVLMLMSVVVLQQRYRL
ncbi:MAG TPA: asparagine synthase-related protein, partial [Opitutus sp.]|nr:asparagine synthase-related protein [Opitutus sp.]